nr:hypothetical protein BJQ95_01561 [Cryobacterium sp. SO1]
MDSFVRGGLRPAANRAHLTTQPHGATGTRNTTGSKAGRTAMSASRNLKSNDAEPTQLS